MKNTRKVWILILILIGFAVNGCKEPDDNNTTHSHTWGEWSLTTAATCVAQGSQTRACTSCAETQTEVIAINPDAHDMQAAEGAVEVEPTCTEDGLGKIACANEGCDHIEYGEIDALGHDMKEDWAVFEAETCEEDGEEERFCHRECGHREELTLPKLGHHHVATGVVHTAATCTTPGAEEMKCGNLDGECGDIIEGAVINALTHLWIDNWVITKQPNCTDNGDRYRVCDRLDGCEERQTETNTINVHALGHDWKYDEGATVQTCTQAGSGARQCQRVDCGETSNNPVYPALTHLWIDNWVITKQPTCTANGDRYRICDRLADCDERQTQLDTVNVPALGHEWLVQNWVITKHLTCLANGDRYRECNRSGCSERQTEEDTPNLPRYGSHHYPPTTPATCTTASVRHNCDRQLQNSTGNYICGIANETEAVVPALGHEGTVPPFAANCTTAGNSALSGNCVRFANCGHVVPGTPTSPDPANHAAGCTPIYIITGSGTAFTVARGSLCKAQVGTANQTIENTLTAIRTHAGGAAVTIQFGNGTDELDIGTASAAFNNTGGAWTNPITLTGRITSANATATQGTVALAGDISITSTADIAVTSTGVNGRAVFNGGTGTVTISGGTVSAATGQAVNNASTGTVTISGGTVSATNGQAVYNGGTGTVTISGGTVSATTGRAVDNNSTGKIIVTGTSDVTSANPSVVSGTIFIASSGTATGPRLEISGGTVRNTANTADARAVRNASSGAVTISGGTVSVSHTDALSVEVNNAVGSIILSGSPLISGSILAAAGRLSVDSGFNPGANTYRLNFGSYPIGSILVVGGADFIGNFTIAATTASAGVLPISKGADIIVGTTYHFSRQVSGSVHTITRVEQPGTANEIQPIIDAIRAEAAGSSVTIQFGNGTDVLDIGMQSAGFNNTGGTWTNPITLTGRITSANATNTQGTVALADTVSINSTADIAVTSAGVNGRAILNGGTGTVTISGGRVSATTGQAVNNFSTGKIIVSGTADITSANVTTTAGTIVIASSGTDTEPLLEISGGTVTCTGSNQSNAIISSGSVIISGGTIRNTINFEGATAIRLTGSRTLTISGGTVSSNSGPAVRNIGNGAVSISGTAELTSGGADGSGSLGTILNSGIGTITVTGGTVRNTSGFDGRGRAIYNASTGEVNISGGTVEAMSAVGVGVAVWNNSTGSITISGTDTVITSANVTLAAGTVNNNAGGSITITGGTIRNTANHATNGANANAIRNGAAGTVTLSNCTVQANAHADAHAIRNVTTDTSRIIFGENVTILGNLLNCPAYP